MPPSCAVLLTHSTWAGHFFISISISRADEVNITVLIILLCYNIRYTWIVEARVKCSYCDGSTTCKQQASPSHRPEECVTFQCVDVSTPGVLWILLNVLLCPRSLRKELILDQLPGSRKVKGEEPISVVPLTNELFLFGWIRPLIPG